MNESSQNPVVVLRDGTLKITIWKNPGHPDKKGPFFSATAAKTYEKDGTLRDGQSYVGGDLLRLSELARRAYNVMRDLRRQARREADSSAAPD